MSCFRSNVQTWISSHPPFLNLRWMSEWALRKAKKFPWRANLSVHSRWKPSQPCLKMKVCRTGNLGSLVFTKCRHFFLTGSSAQWHRMLHPFGSVKSKAVAPAVLLRLRPFGRGSAACTSHWAALLISWFCSLQGCLVSSILQGVLNFCFVAWFWNSLSILNQNVLM